MQNLRLPEFDKSRIIDSQKDLVFQSETCKYDVILGADFLTKTGIDVKYSTGTMEWFDTELSLRNPHLLETKDKKYMGTHCHTKYMGTHCHKKLLGHIANKKYRGTDCYQEVMENIFCDDTDAVYVDEIGAFSHS